MKMPTFKMDAVARIDDETKEYIDQKIEAVKNAVRDTLVILAIGIPCVIVFGVAATITGNVVSDKLTD